MFYCSLGLMQLMAEDSLALQKQQLLANANVREMFLLLKAAVPQLCLCPHSCPKGRLVGVVPCSVLPRDGSSLSQSETPGLAECLTTLKIQQ